MLEKFQLGENFISWVKLLYTNPTVRILSNQIISPKFHLSRGNRQGCALSPILFAFAIETLAETIRLHLGIHGYNTKYTRNQILLYADDVLLYITNSQVSIPNVLNVIEQFGAFSGYRINSNKSEIMPIKAQDPSQLQKFPFGIDTEKFRYLGVHVTRKY